MLLKRGSTSRLVIESPGSWSAIYLANLKLFFTVYILVAIGSRKGTKNLGRLYVDVLTADRISLKDEVINFTKTVKHSKPRTSWFETFRINFTISEIASEFFKSLRRSVVCFPLFTMKFNCLHSAIET